MHDGVDKVFARQAGRELRIMVVPEQVADIAAQTLGRAVAKQIEEELSYPGQIRVTVVHDSQATETAVTSARNLTTRALDHDFMDLHRGPPELKWRRWSS